MTLLLGIAGLYGVIAYSVSQRPREIGIRVALGTEPGAVYRMIRERGWLVGGSARRVWSGVRGRRGGTGAKADIRREFLGCADAECRPG